MASLVREKVDGRDATVAYLRGNMQPCEPDQAEYVKIMFDDGEDVWCLTAPKRKQTATVHVYEYDGVKMAQVIVNGSAYQIDVTPEIAKLGVGDHEVEVS